MNPQEMLFNFIEEERNKTFIQIKKFKEDGNTKFREGKLIDAEKCYREGIKFFEDSKKNYEKEFSINLDMKKFFFQQIWPNIENVHKDLWKNIGSIYLKQKNYQECLDIDLGVN